MSYSDRKNNAVSVGLRRQYAYPLDVSAVFESLADFQAYITNDTTYSTDDSVLAAMIKNGAYAGQIVSVVVDDTATAYIIHKVGALEDGEDITDRYSKVGSDSSYNHYVMVHINSSLKLSVFLTELSATQYSNLVSFGIAPTVGETIILTYIIVAADGKRVFGPTYATVDAYDGTYYTVTLLNEVGDYIDIEGSGSGSGSSTTTYEDLSVSPSTIQVENSTGSSGGGSGTITISGGSGSYSVAASSSISSYFTALSISGSTVSYTYYVPQTSDSSTIYGTITITDTVTGNTIDVDVTCYEYSCLTGDTLITLADGTRKRIDSIEVTDRILSIDPDTGEFVADTIISTDSKEKKLGHHYDKYVFSDGTVITTIHRHRFYNVTQQQMVHLDTWNIGDKAYKQDGTIIELTEKHIKIEEKEQYHYSLYTVHHNYFANGVLCGDRFTRQITKGV